MKTRILLGNFEPDKHPFLRDGLVDMANAYPSSLGYRPAGQFTAITSAMPDDFNGGTAYLGSDNTPSLVAGTADALYRYSGSWDALATGLTVPSRWKFTQFGDKAIAVNGGPTYSVDLIAATAAALAGAPTATSIATVRDFVVYGQAGGDLSLIQWSAFNDETGNTPGVDQAGFQPMLSGGPVMGIAGGEYGVIVQRSRIVRMSYTGDDFVWQFDEIESNIGAISQGSIISADKLVFYLSDRGFMKFDGNASTPIGLERVDKTFFDSYSRQDLDSLYAAVDPRRNAVAWAMPGEPGKLWIYNWVLDRWSVISISLIAALPGFTFNVPLEELDTLFPSGIDSIPYSLDDPRFAGGDPLFLMVDASSTVGVLSGENQAVFFTTPFAEMAQGRRARVRKSRPLGDAVDGVSITLDARQRLGDAAGTTSRSTIMPSGDMPVRSSGRYISTRLDYEEGAVWTYAQGVEHEFEAGEGR